MTRDLSLTIKQRNIETLDALTIPKPSQHKLRAKLEATIMGGVIGQTTGMEEELTERDSKHGRLQLGDVCLTQPASWCIVVSQNGNSRNALSCILRYGSYGF